MAGKRHGQSRRSGQRRRVGLTRIKTAVTAVIVTAIAVTLKVIETMQGMQLTQMRLNDDNDAGEPDIPPHHHHYDSNQMVLSNRSCFI